MKIEPYSVAVTVQESELWGPIRLELVKLMERKLRAGLERAVDFSMKRAIARRLQLELQLAYNRAARKLFFADLEARIDADEQISTAEWRSLRARIDKIADEHKQIDAELNPFPAPLTNHTRTSVFDRYAGAYWRL